MLSIHFPIGAFTPLQSKSELQFSQYPFLPQTMFIPDIPNSPQSPTVLHSGLFVVIYYNNIINEYKR
jgi:hypothetical protein